MHSENLGMFAVHTAKVASISADLLPLACVVGQNMDLTRN
jgi:hypothetical protein